MQHVYPATHFPLRKRSMRTTQPRMSVMADMGRAMPIQLAKVMPDPSCSKLRFLYRSLKKLQQVVQTSTERQRPLAVSQ